MEEVLQKILEVLPEKMEDPLVVEIANARQELKNAEEKLKEVLKDNERITNIVNKIEKLQTRISKFKEIKPTCLESEAEHKFEVFVNRLINPHIDHANSLKKELGKIISEAAKDIAHVERRTKEIRWFIDFISKLGEKTLQQSLHEINETISRIQSSLNAKKQQLEELRKSHNIVSLIITELRELGESLHRLEKRVRTRTRELPGVKPDEIRIKEEKIIEYVCTVCGRKIREEPYM